MSAAGKPLRIAALVKQVPRFEEMRLGPDGRLERAGLPLEMNPYCRRAVAQGVELARQTGGTCTVITLGPQAAEDVLREAVAWGADEGILVTDAAFAGSDTLATARALAAAIQRTSERDGPFDVILTGRNSVDADTGQVGPQIAEALDLPFLTGVRELSLGPPLQAHLEYDDGFVDAEVDLPALLSCAERLCDPCKVDPAGRAAVEAARIRRLTAADLGDGPWGAAGSPTRVGPVRSFDQPRRKLRLAGPVADQVRAAVDHLVEWKAFDPALPNGTRESALTASGLRGSGRPVPGPFPTGAGRPVVAVLVEPGRDEVTGELLGAAAQLADEIDGYVVAAGPVPLPPLSVLGGMGTDRLIAIESADDVAAALVAEDVAAAFAGWAEDVQPWAVLVPSTSWGREVASRAAWRLQAGLTGDAIELEVNDEGRLVGWKPAFGGSLAAAIEATSPIQMATVRPGTLPRRTPRGAAPPEVEAVTAQPRGRVRMLAEERDDDLETLARARVVIGLGTGVLPEDYGALEALRLALGAELGATRKVTDKAWMPRARQIGITGRSIDPDLYIALGIAGKFNHMSGVRRAKVVVAVNRDPDAPVFEAADIGIVGDWREVADGLLEEIRKARA